MYWGVGSQQHGDEEVAVLRVHDEHQQLIQEIVVFRRETENEDLMVINEESVPFVGVHVRDDEYSIPSKLIIEPRIVNDK